MVTGEFHSQRPVTRRFDIFYDLRLNKRLSKRSESWWFETPQRSIWRHCNVTPSINNTHYLEVVYHYVTLRHLSPFIGAKFAINLWSTTCTQAIYKGVRYLMANFWHLRMFKIPFIYHSVTLRHMSPFIGAKFANNLSSTEYTQTMSFLTYSII